jgi:hypothetical protein
MMQGRTSRVPRRIRLRPSEDLFVDAQVEVSTGQSAFRNRDVDTRRNATGVAEERSSPQRHFAALTLSPWPRSP